MEQEYYIDKKSLWSKWLLNSVLAIILLAINGILVYLIWREEGPLALIVGICPAFLTFMGMFGDARRYYYFKMTITKKYIRIFNGMSGPLFHVYWDEIREIALKKGGQLLVIETLPGEKIKLNHYIDQYQSAFQEIVRYAVAGNPKVIVRHMK